MQGWRSQILVLKLTIFSLRPQMDCVVLVKQHANDTLT